LEVTTPQERLWKPPPRKAAGTLAAMAGQRQQISKYLLEASNLISSTLCVLGLDILFIKNVQERTKNAFINSIIHSKIHKITKT